MKTHTLVPIKELQCSDRGSNSSGVWGTSIITLQYVDSKLKKQEIAKALM
jgi:hypothetical protein